MATHWIKVCYPRQKQVCISSILLFSTFVSHVQTGISSLCTTQKCICFQYYYQDTASECAAIYSTQQTVSCDLSHTTNCVLPSTPHLPHKVCILLTSILAVVTLNNKHKYVVVPVHVIPHTKFTHHQIDR